MSEQFAGTMAVQDRQRFDIGALERYLRERSKHSLARRPELWLGGSRGAMTDNGA